MSQHYTHACQYQFIDVMFANYFQAIFEMYHTCYKDNNNDTSLSNHSRNILKVLVFIWLINVLDILN